MKKFFAMSLCLLALGFAPSCKDEEEDCAESVAEASAKAADMVTASFTYALDTTSTANCNALKNAIQAYINEAEDVKDCPGVSASERAQFEQGIQDAEDNLATLPC